MTFGLIVINVPDLSVLDLSKDWRNLFERSVDVDLCKGGDFLIEFECALGQNVDCVKIIGERLIKSLYHFSVTVIHAGVNFLGKVLITHFL
jgi:hypothetical protein